MATALDPQTPDFDLSKIDISRPGMSDYVKNRALLDVATRDAAKAKKEQQLEPLPSDALQWIAANEQYQKPFTQIPQEGQQHFINAYGDAAKANEMYNKQLSNVTGMGPYGEAPTQVVMDESGKTQAYYKTPDTTKIINPQDFNSIATKIASYDQRSQEALSRMPAAEKERLLARVYQINPNYSTAVGEARVALQKDFTSGTSAKAITSANTAIGHLASLKDDFARLQNSQFPLANMAGNWLKKQGGAPEAVAFEAKADMVASEIARMLKGGAPAEGEIKELRSKLNPNMSPEQLDNVLKGWLGLMAGRVSELNQQYKGGMQTEKRDKPFLSEHSIRVLPTLGVNPADFAPDEPGIERPTGGNAQPSGRTSTIDPSQPGYDRARADAVQFVRQNPSDPRVRRIMATYGITPNELR